MGSKRLSASEARRRFNLLALTHNHARRDCESRLCRLEHVVQRRSGDDRVRQAVRRSQQRGQVFSREERHDGNGRGEPGQDAFDDRPQPRRQLSSSPTIQRWASNCSNRITVSACTCRCACSCTPIGAARKTARKWNISLRWGSAPNPCRPNRRLRRRCVRWLCFLVGDRSGLRFLPGTGGNNVTWPRQPLKMLGTHPGPHLNKQGGKGAR